MLSKFPILLIYRQFVGRGWVFIFDIFTCVLVPSSIMPDPVLSI